MSIDEDKEIVKIISDSNIESDIKKRFVDFISNKYKFRYICGFYYMSNADKKHICMNDEFETLFQTEYLNKDWKSKHKNKEHGMIKESGTIFFNCNDLDDKSNENTIEILNKINNIEEKCKQINKELQAMKNTIITIVNDSNEVTKIQFIPVDIYIDTNNSNEIFEVYSSVIDLLENIGFKKDIELDPIKGSWYKKLIAKSKEILTEEEVQNKLKEVEYALEVKILKDQSEVDKNQSEALSNILKSVENIPNAAIKIGSLLVVKITSETGEATVQVRSLTILELHLLNKRPDLLLKPNEILGALATMIEENDRLN